MRALSFIVSVLLAGSAYAQAPASVYTPTQRDAAGPTYINATVVRVDPRHDTITFRSESGEVSLTVEGDAVAGLRRLRPGDEVVLGYRVDDRTGRPTQIVTAILAGEEMAQSGLVATSGTTTTTTLAGAAHVNGLTTVAGQPGGGTVSSPGVSTGTGDVANTGTFTTGGSPFAAVIPSLPSVGAARELATLDYDAGVRALALKANEIDAHWFGYRDTCLRTGAVSADIDAPNRDREWFLLFEGGVGTPVDDNCRQLLVEMTRIANDWKDVMTRLEDTTRRNDVLPGAMREIRQRYRVEF